MFEFSIDNEKYRIEVKDSQELATFSQYSPLESKWKWRQVLETSDLGEGKLYATVKEFLERFIAMVNKTLNENHGEVEIPTDFSDPIEELKYRIDNNLELVSKNISIID